MNKKLFIMLCVGAFCVQSQGCKFLQTDAGTHTPAVADNNNQDTETQDTFFIQSQGPHSAIVAWNGLPEDTYLIQARPSGESHWTEFAVENGQTSYTFFHLEKGQTYEMQLKNMSQNTDWTASTVIVFDGTIASGNSYDGTVYYVANDGNDNNTGTQEAPFASFTKVENILASATGPVSVLFKRGDTWYGTLTLPQVSGTDPDHRVRIGAYGDGKQPKFFGSANINTLNWTQYSGDIYQTSINMPGAGAIFIDGEMVYPGRSDIYVMQAGGGATSAVIIDPSGRNLIGSQAAHRGDQWNAESQIITDQTALSGNQVKLNWVESPNSANNGEQNNGLYIYNHLDFVDQSKEWMYNENQQTLYLHTANNVLSKDIRAPQYAYGIEVLGDHYEISDINIKYYWKDGIFINGEYVRVQYNTITHNYNAAVFMDGNTDHAQVLHNKINDISGVGVHAFFTSFGEFMYNDIRNISDKAWGRSTGKHDQPFVANNQFSTGISGMSTESNIARGNYLENIGYVGIRFDGRNHLIEQNIIVHAMQMLGDGGAIYSYQAPNSAFPTHKNLVQYNIIEMNSNPNNQVGYKMNVNAKNLTANVYFDNATHDNVLQNNVFDGCSLFCVLLNRNNNDHVIRKNIAYSDNKLLQVTNEPRPSPNGNNDNNASSFNIVSDDHIIEDNLFVSLDHNVEAVYTRNYTPDANYRPGSFSGNTYLSPYSNMIAEDRRNAVLGDNTNLIISPFNYNGWINYINESGASFPKTGWTYTNKATAKADLNLVSNKSLFTQTFVVPVNHNLVDGTPTAGSIMIPGMSAKVTVKQ